MCPDAAKCEKADCPFAHRKAELTVDKEEYLKNYKTEMCKDGGDCEKENCVYAHCKAEIRDRDKPMSEDEKAKARLGLKDNISSNFGNMSLNPGKSIQEKLKR